MREVPYEGPLEATRERELNRGVQVEIESAARIPAQLHVQPWPQPILAELDDEDG